MVACGHGLACFVEMTRAANFAHQWFAPPIALVLADSRAHRLADALRQPQLVRELVGALEPRRSA